MKHIKITVAADPENATEVSFATLGRSVKIAIKAKNQRRRRLAPIGTTRK